jgi:deoxyadenosine/deoxycytidine kinase
MSQPSFTVAVEGLIGAGKTEFLKHFDSNQVTILPEPLELWQNFKDINFLQLLYKNPEKYFALFQTYCFCTKIEQHAKVESDKPLKIMERSIFSSMYCFIENYHHKNSKSTLLTYEVLSSMFKQLTKIMAPLFHVDLIIYLRLSPETALERVKKRNRPEEKNVDLDFLKHLSLLHDEWLLGGKNFTAPVIVLDVDKDFEYIREPIEAVKKLILRRLTTPSTLI